MRFLLLIIFGLFLATAAKSDGIYNPTGGGVGFIDGVNNFTTSAAPPTCNGTLDLSTGCATPLVGNF